MVIPAIMLLWNGAVMSTRTVFTLSLVMTSGLVAQPRSPAPQVAPPLTIAAARDVLVKLQAAIDAHETRTVATLVRFPLIVTKGPRGSTTVPSVRVFMQMHATVFTQRVRKAILAQNPDSLVVRDGAALIGNGIVLIGMRCESSAPSSCAAGVTAVNPYRAE